MRGQEVSEEPFQARFPELAAQMRKLKQIVEIVDRVAEGAHFAELLFRILQVLLHSFELRKALFNLPQPPGHIGSGGTELLAEAGAKTFEQARNLRFYIHLRGSRNAAQQNCREPKQDKGSDEHGNQR